MFPIVSAERLAANVMRFQVIAPRIAKKQKAGQFVIVRVHSHGERIPLTIADAEPAAGTITLIVQGVGKTTKLLNALGVGDSLLDVVGPLGNPSDVRNFGTVAVIAGGVGAAIAYPTARALKLAGNCLLTILGARSRNLVILEQELAQVSDELAVTTDDGSYGEQGLVTDRLRRWLDVRPIDFVLAIGPIPMMRSVAEVTRPAGVRTVVSLNSIMVDGTGMCGGCRVLVGNQAKFACIDGPEFDAHEVDFDLLAKRNAVYREAERSALQRFESHPDVELRQVRAECRLAERHPELGNLNS